MVSGPTLLSSPQRPTCLASLTFYRLWSPSNARVLSVRFLYLTGIFGSGEQLVGVRPGILFSVCLRGELSWGGPSRFGGTRVYDYVWRSSVVRA